MARKKGSVVKVVNGFQARKTVEGQRVVGFGKTAEEAQEALERKVVATSHPTGETLFGVWCDTWLAQKEGRVRETTWTSYEERIRLHIRPTRLAQIPLAQIQVWDLEAFRQSLSPATRARTVKQVRMILNGAVRAGLLGSSPADRMETDKRVKPIRRAVTSVWNEEQVRRFLLAARQDRLFSLYLTALDTGCRMGELLGLFWEDVDLEAGTVRIWRAARWGQLRDVKTERARRTLRLTQQTLSVLRERRQEEGIVFCDTDGGFLHPSNLGRRSFKPIQQRAQVPQIRFHDLRHTAATLWIANGVSPVLVSQRLGHSSVRITLETYAHALPQMENALLEVSERYLSLT